MLDFGKFDKMIKKWKKWINQTRVLLKIFRFLFTELFYAKYLSFSTF